MNNEITPLYDKNVICLLCSTSFNTKKIRSRFLRVETTHSDFFTEYKNSQLNPIFYEVAVCPNCGFSSSDTFSSDMSEESRQSLNQQFTNWKEQDFGEERSLEDAIHVTKLAILSGMLKKEKAIVMAGLCLRLAWMHRLSNDWEQESRYLLQSIDQYKKSYSQVDYLQTTMTEMKVLYLIGELLRRVGEEQEAVHYLSRVVQHKHKHTDPKIVEMAREQWYEMRKNDKERRFS